MTLADKLRPYVKQLQEDANEGGWLAQQTIEMYKMHCSCPRDPGAPALCEAFFNDWLKAKEPTG